MSTQNINVGIIFHLESGKVIDNKQQGLMIELWNNIKKHLIKKNIK